MNQLATTAGTSITSPSILSISYRSASSPHREQHRHAEAMITTDAKFRITGLNETAEALYDFTTAEVTGKKIFDLVKFETIGITLEDAIESFFNEGFWKGDIIYNHFERKLVFSTRCTLIKNKKGKPASIIITTHNVAERYLGEKKLAQSAATEQTSQSISVEEGVIIINADGAVSTANKSSLKILGLQEKKLKGKKLFPAEWKTFRADGTIFPVDDYPGNITLLKGFELKNVVIGLQDFSGKEIWLSLSSRPIFEGYTLYPSSAEISFIEIDRPKTAKKDTDQNDYLFENFIAGSPALGWIYDEDGMLVYGNPKFLDILRSGENHQKNIKEFTPSEQVFKIISDRNRQVLLDEKTVITEDEFPDIHGKLRSYLSYWFIVPSKGPKKLIGGHAVEITESKMMRKEMDKMFERYTFAINASSDDIRDMDISTQMIFHSDTFSEFSGYKKEDIEPTLEWFFDKVHPLDKKRVRQQIDHCLKNNITNWDNEYRFQLANRTYRHLLDKAYAVYEEGKLTRVIGVMQDITERKKLEAQLLHEQVQKQKIINQAIIQAQDKERNRISGELHDNVNQLLMSAKLHVCVAKARIEGETELLDKANEYLLMAVEEIRNLSKKLNSSVIVNGGLQKSIADIGATMMLLKNIQLHTYMADDVVELMTPAQQMMLYRIFQEQSNNILKYAETNEAIISLKVISNNFELIISDNGQGFDKNEQKATGIGFINIFNRIEAFSGKAEIITSPGNGCTLLIHFPVSETET